MTISERAHRRHRRRILVAAALVTTASCATAPPPAAPPSDLLSAKRLPDKGAVKKPKPSHKPTAKPSHSPSPRPHVAALPHTGTRHGDWIALGVQDTTAYCETGNHTASGKWPREGMVATLSAIPFGTRVRIEGQGVYVVEDRIGAYSSFDIFMDSCDAAMQYGRRQLHVWREAA